MILDWSALNQKHSRFLLSCQSQFLETWNFFVHHALWIVNHFHRFHLRMILDWSALNQKHSRFLISRQLQFLEMWKFFVHDVFPFVDHFPQFDSSQARCRGSSQLLSPEHTFILFRFRRVLCSLLGVHFQAYVRLEFRILIYVKNSKNGRRRVSLSERKCLSGMDEGDHRWEEKGNG
jgi:hypothetical protein